MAHTRKARRYVRAAVVGFTLASVAASCGSTAERTPSTEVQTDVPVASAAAPACLAERPNPCPTPASLPTCPEGHADGVVSVDGVLAEPPRVSGGGMILRGRLAPSAPTCTQRDCAQACCNHCTASVVFEGSVPGRSAALRGGPALECRGDESQVCCATELPAGAVILTGDIQTKGDRVWFENPVLCKL